MQYMQPDNGQIWPTIVIHMYVKRREQRSTPDADRYIIYGLHVDGINADKACYRQPFSYAIRGKSPKAYGYCKPEKCFHQTHVDSLTTDKTTVKW